MNLKSFIRSIPDFPSKGIIYRDITPLLVNPEAVNACLESVLKELPSKKIDKVVGIESRGFIFAIVFAQHLKAGLVPVRNAGKLRFEPAAADYEREYAK